MKRKLFLIFLAALLIRFLYFPQDIYFAYDQARDSFTGLEILKGDFKILGPPSAANPNLFAGPLIYYIYAPIYFLFSKSPEAASAFLRVYNALGVFLVFAIGSILFNKKVGVLASLLFALSYESSQYSLFLSHQALAVVTVLLFYLGLALVIFKNNQKGLLLAAAGAGLSIQFHYLYVYLLPLAAGLFFLFRKTVSLNPKYIFMSAAIFLLTISTYILAEIKFNFRVLSTLATGGGQNLALYLNEVVFTANRFIHDNFLENYSLTPFILLLLAIIVYKRFSSTFLFLSVWFLASLLPYLLSGTPSYYYAAATNVSLFLITAFVIVRLLPKQKLLGLALLVGIIINNLYLVSSINHKGVNKDFVIQPGMLLSEEKKALDYVYSDAVESFAVKALTVPLNVNTTWSYLFEWYGEDKYGRLPLWVGPAAEGYAGNLTVISDRAKLPETQFLIIEPTVGIREPIIEEFFREESYFTKVVEEKTFGTIKVQKRVRI